MSNNQRKRIAAKGHNKSRDEAQAYAENKRRFPSRRVRASKLCSMTLAAVSLGICK